MRRVVLSNTGAVFDLRKLDKKFWVIGIEIPGFHRKEDDFKEYSTWNHDPISICLKDTECGFVSLYGLLSYDSKKFALVSEIIVAKQLRNKGIAKLLYNEALRIVKTKKIASGLASDQLARSNQASLFWNKYAQRSITLKFSQYDLITKYI